MKTTSLAFSLFAASFAIAPAYAAPPVAKPAAGPAPVAAPARPAAPVVAAATTDDAPSMIGIASLQTVPAAAKLKPTDAVKRVPTAVALEEVEQLRPVITKAAKRVVAATRSCKAQDLKFAWPLAGDAAKVWATSNYTDLDSSSGKKDYKGGVGPAAINYDGHRGYDICVGSFREMDTNAVPARAAAPGKVIEVDDAHFDRNTSCTGTWNYVLVEHANGFVSYYGHIKKGSASVKVNDMVTTGQALGIVGSAGCSTHPHLHFEVHDCDNAWIEPAQHGMWQVAPSSYEKSGILDVMLRATGSENGGLSVASIKDPSPNPTTVAKNQWLHVGFSAALRSGDEVHMRVTTIGGDIKNSYWTPDGRYSQRVVYFDSYKMASVGPAYISVFVNGSLKAIRMVTVQ